MKIFNKKKQKIINLFFIFLKPFFKNKNLKYIDNEVNTILLLDLHLIGDIVLLIPFLEVLILKHPNAKINLVCGSWAKNILKFKKNIYERIEITEFNAPWVTKSSSTNIFILFKIFLHLRRTYWDLTYDMRGDLRNSLILFLLRNKYRVGFNLMNNYIFLTHSINDSDKFVHLSDYHFYLAKYTHLINETFIYLPRFDNIEKLQKNNYIGIHFGASMKLRIPNNSMLKFFINQIIKINGLDSILLIFKSNDNKYIIDEIINHCNDFKYKFTTWEGNLENFIFKLNECKSIYCLDSGPAHLAAALGLNVNVLFGPSNSLYTKPLGKNVHVIQNNFDLQCWPCDGIKCNNNVKQKCYTNINLLN